MQLIVPRDIEREYALYSARTEAIDLAASVVWGMACAALWIVGVLMTTAAAGFRAVAPHLDEAGARLRSVGRDW